MSFAPIELDVRRIWAALQFVDAMSLRTIESPLQVDLLGATRRRNRSGLFVVVGLAGAAQASFVTYEGAFDPIPAVAPLVLVGTVADPEGRYLPRRFTLALPRTSAAVPGLARAPLYEATSVTLDPTPATPLLPTWAALRLSVQRGGRPAAHAAIRVRRPAGAVLGRGMTDARGEALVAVVGVAQVTPGLHELVVEREIATEVVVSFDTGADAVAVIDPDALAERADGSPGLARLVVPRSLATGRIEVMNLILP